MASSPSIPSPAPGRVRIPQLWTNTLPGSPRGVAIAREKAHVLAWDDKNWLCLFNRQGERQGQVRSREPLVAACCADDGLAIAAAGTAGRLSWLGPDLTILWEKTLPERAVSLAMDPFGQYLAVADGKSALTIYDRLGRRVLAMDSPRPLHHLAFVPGVPYLVGCSDYGLVGCLDLEGRWLWRDGLVVHIGALAVTGRGEQILLACFTAGLRRYSVTRKDETRLEVADGCRLCAVSFDGRLSMAADLTTHLHFLTATGRSLHKVDLSAAAIALGPLGDLAVVAVLDGPIVALDLRALNEGLR